MHRPPSLLHLIIRYGFVAAVVATLAAAMLLTATGLVRELLPGRTIVMTALAPTPTAVPPAGAVPPPLVALATTSAEGDRGDEPDDDTADPGHDGTPTPAAADAEASADARPDAAGQAQPGTPERSVRARPTPGPRGAPRAVADVPIVMYHHVGPLPPNADVFRRDLTVSPDLFERTLQSLAEREVQTVGMADLMEHFEGGPALPAKSVILTFDDGYDDNYEHAFRLLKQYNMVGTFFVTTDFVERPGYLTWAQIGEMADAGMEIEAHSVNHADFTKIGPAELRRQLSEPREYLEQATGRKIRFLAYPAGKYSPAVMAASKAAGYEAAVTVLHGTRHPASGLQELRRVRARGTDTLPEIMTRMTLPSWRQ